MNLTETLLKYFPVKDRTEITEAIINGVADFLENFPLTSSKAIFQSLEEIQEQDQLGVKRYLKYCNEERDYHPSTLITFINKEFKVFHYFQKIFISKKILFYMKRGFGWAFVLVIVLMVNFASAAYVCSLNSSLTQEKKDIDVGEEKLVNGLFLGIAKSRVTLAVKRYEADALIYFAGVKLTDEKPTQTLEFSNDANVSVNLLNVSEEGIRLTIGSSTVTIEELDWKTVGGYEIYLASAIGEYPGNTEVKVYAGKKKVELSNYEELDKIVTYDGVDYVIELYAASETSAIVQVSRCDNSSAKISEVADEELNATQNDTMINETNSSGADENTSEENSTEIVVNDTENSTDLNASTNEGAQENVGENESNWVGFIAFWGLIVSVVIFGFLMFRHWRNKKMKIQAAAPIQMPPQ